MLLYFVISLTEVLKRGILKSNDPGHSLFAPSSLLPTALVIIIGVLSYTFDLARGHLVAGWIKYCRLQPELFENLSHGLCLTSEKEN